MHLFTECLTEKGSAALSPSIHGRTRKNRYRGLRPPRRTAALTFLAGTALLGVRGQAAAQQVALASLSAATLPDAPQPQQSTLIEAGVLPEGESVVGGTVLDATGAAVPGAQVCLADADGTVLLTVASGSNGEFRFSKLPAGTYTVVIKAKGFAAFTTAGFSISAHQDYEVANIALGIASASSDVTVLPTEQVAAQQIKAEEKQRVLGIVPNFYVSYVHDAAPLTTKQKFTLASHDTLDWTSWVGISAAAGIEQANNSYKGYGQGAAGYSKRWAARFADGRTSDYLSHAVFASLFHQDPRYFYQGTGTKKSRLIHALSNSVIARGDSGKNMPNYSYLLGAMVSGAISNAYYPSADRGANLVFTNAFLGIAGRAGGSVLQEFIGKRVTKNTPKGDPASPSQP